MSSSHRRPALPPPGATAPGAGATGRNPLAKLDAAVRPAPAQRGDQELTILLCVLLVVAMGLRLALFAFGPAQNVQRAYEPDSPRYVELAENLQSGRVFSRSEERTGVIHVPLAELRSQLGQREKINQLGQFPEVFRTPGYPLLLAALLQVGQSVDRVLMIQAALDALSALLVFGIGMQLFQHRKAALAAALLFAIHPALVSASMSMLSETLLVFLLLLGWWLTLVGRRQVVWALVGGLILGGAALVKPIAVLVGFSLALWLAVTQRQKAGWLAAGAVLLGSLVGPGAWMVRNQQVGAGWRLSTVPQVNAWFYTASYMNLTAEGMDISEMNWKAMVARQLETLKSELKPGEDVYDGMQRLALAEMRAQPKVYAQVLARSWGKLWLDHSAGAFMAQLGREYHPTGLREQVLSGKFDLAGVTDKPSFLVALAWTGWNGLLLLAMLAGAVVLAWRRQWTTLLLLGGLLAYFMLATQANGLERFRAPMIGVQALLIGALLVRAKSDNAGGGKAPAGVSTTVGGGSAIRAAAAAGAGSPPGAGNVPPLPPVPPRRPR